jgi:imidazoleglycerol phosphate synthase glutamine amidotransferase subunit HisH
MGQGQSVLNKVYYAGAGAGPSVICVNALCKVAIPLSMSYFGIVIPGVGTYHAAGGAAATFQAVGAAVSPYVPYSIAAICVGERRLFA